MLSRGVLYVAGFPELHIELAFLSAESVKRRFPTLPIALITDQPKHPLCGFGCFDTVIEAEPVLPARLADTPYDRTLYLEPDTRLLNGDVTTLFDVLDRSDTAMMDDDRGVMLYRRNAAGEGVTALDPAHVHILHSPALRRSIGADLLNIAHALGQSDNAEKLYDYVAGRLARMPLRLHDPIPRNLPGEGEVAPPEEWATPILRRADLHQRHGQLKKAADLYREVLAHDRDNPFAQLGFAQLEIQSGRPHQALGMAEQVLARHSQLALAHKIRGEALFLMRHPQDAVPSLQQAASQGHLEAEYFLGHAWFALRDYGKAVETYQKVIARRPNYYPAANNLLAALLGSHRYGAAADHAAKLTADEWNARALAFQWIALVEAGRKEEAGELCDLDRLAKIETIAVPQGYESLAQFNRTLAETLASESSLTYEPADRTTRKGRQSGNLAASTAPAIQALNSVIRAAVERRLNDAAALGNHPFGRFHPRSYHMNSWCVVLEEEGHQAPHIHAGGWLSGVYYVEIPDDISADDADHRGWLTFGRGDALWHRPETAVAEQPVFPAPGLLLTFPSFVWHNTVPLVSKKRRISYAFDIVPD